MFKYKPEKELDKIAAGAFGAVYNYRSKGHENGGKYVLKKQRVDTEELRRVIQEIVLVFDCVHENILPVIGFDLRELPPNDDESATTEDKLKKYEVYMKMPKMEKSLKEQLGKPFEEKTILRYFYGITCGLRYLHGKSIAHRDIKPENILLDKHDVIKVADIGLARHLGDQSASFIPMAGSKSYMAPEVLGRPLNEPPMGRYELQKADLWSLGVTMLELCLKRRNVVNPDSPSIQKENDFAKEIESLKDYSSSLIDLLRRLLKSDADDRIGIEELFITLRQLLDLPPINTGDEGNENEQEKYGENKIKNEQEQARLASGEARQQEAGRREDLLDIRERLRRFYGGFFLFNADKIAKSLEIVLNPNIKKSIDEATVNIILKGVIEELKQNNHCKLAQLTVKLDECTKFTDNGLTELVSYLDSTFEGLQYLHLSFAQCTKLTDRGLVTLVTHIGSTFKSIQKLYLNFSQCNSITDLGLTALALHVGNNLKDLLHLDLDFSKCKQIKGLSFEELGTQIRSNLTNLTLLRLNFANCSGIMDAGFGQLVSQIRSNLPNLTQLHLNFMSCLKINDQGFQQLTSEFGSNLTKLIRLHLNFAWCKIADSEVQKLAAQIGLNLESLRHLDLNFHGCEQITSLIGQESNVWSKLNNVRQLHLDFSSCTKVKDSAFKNLVSEITSNLRKIEQLNLNFASCIEITDSGAHGLKSQIPSSLGKLKKFDLDLINCNKITANFRKDLEKAYKGSGFNLKLVAE